MIKILDKKRCAGCHACFNICPNQCITMRPDDEGFLYPQIDLTKCIDCHQCEVVCPLIKSDFRKLDDKSPVAYAAYNSKEETRMLSSSGGLFSMMAEYVISQGGIVFGVGFNKKFEAVHMYIDNIDKLGLLRGSKYVQSKIGDTYRKAQIFLNEGRLVLFTGTPCQINGLLCFLKKEYENLITQDIICHGVPSPMVWNKYVSFREKCAGSTTKQVAFRRKAEGWKRYSVSFFFKNDTEYRENLHNDLYMKAFSKDICLRPSCYDCGFKEKQRSSDITLADFWGIQNVVPKMDDDRGTSLVFVHSKKGQQLFDIIKENIVYQKVDADTAIQYNPSMILSALKNPKREMFLTDIKKNDFKTVVLKYCKDNNILFIKKLLLRIISKMKRLLKGKN